MRNNSSRLVIPAPQLPLLLDGPDSRAIERFDFPFEHLSTIAEHESWRKEINRPTYHIHKWWAQRLGSVFRAIALGTFAPYNADILNLFYGQTRFPSRVVFDPFMGSGTTVGEAIKLGIRAIGRDINPVAYFLVKNSLSIPPRHELLSTFAAIEHDVASRISEYYRAHLPSGAEVPVLYYFWVKQIDCPLCKGPVDLFSRRVFAEHAYPKRYPAAHAICPACGEINSVRYDARRTMCSACRAAYDPSVGPVQRSKVACPNCHATFPIIDQVRVNGSAPRHRLYAKMVLYPNGEKGYVKANEFDENLYAQAVRDLGNERVYPVNSIDSGYNTDQILNYSYTRWHQLFNPRQLLCLGLLADRISRIDDPSLKSIFTCLFSGMLEFNNMFASFKGEGTGAVRHMFYHHVLKPERTPIEANVWGTPKSSGSFSTLFHSRLLRAREYADHPFEIKVNKQNGKQAAQKVFGLSAKIDCEVADTFVDFCQGKTAYLSCGDSSHTDLAAGSVDAVITDPPFFDNVHYSQLADFFYVWQRYILGSDGTFASESTRSEAEVQHTSAQHFTRRLEGVWRECRRVLKPDGLLVFTYHHSRVEGWRSILQSLIESGFAVVQTHPIKSEMSVAAPKHQAAEPIDLDIIFVCRKVDAPIPPSCSSDFLADAVSEAKLQLQRLANGGREFSRNDVRVVLMARIVARLSRSTPDVLDAFDKAGSTFEKALDALAFSIAPHASNKGVQLT